MKHSALIRALLDASTLLVQNRLETLCGLLGSPRTSGNGDGVVGAPVGLKIAEEVQEKMARLEAVLKVKQDRYDELQIAIGLRNTQMAKQVSSLSQSQLEKERLETSLRMQIEQADRDVESALQELKAESDEENDDEENDAAQEVSKTSQQMEQPWEQLSLAKKEKKRLQKELKKIIKATTMVNGESKIELNVSAEELAELNDEIQAIKVDMAVMQRILASFHESGIINAMGSMSVISMKQNKALVPLQSHEIACIREASPTFALEIFDFSINLALLEMAAKDFLRNMVDKYFVEKGLPANWSYYQSKTSKFTGAPGSGPYMHALHICKDWHLENDEGSPKKPYVLPSSMVVIMDRILRDNTAIKNLLNYA